MDYIHIKRLNLSKRLVLVPDLSGLLFKVNIAVECFEFQLVCAASYAYCTVGIELVNGLVMLL